MYKSIRNVHLLLASLSLPFLLMYGISAVQMAHNGWFTLRPTVHEQSVTLAPATSDARRVARELMDARPDIRGELTAIQSGAAGISFRIVVPGTVHEVRYDPGSGDARVKTTLAGVMGMLNRLHHAAGLWPETRALRIWGVAVAVVSAALLLIGATGIYMWWTRRTERRLGRCY